MISAFIVNYHSAHLTIRAARSIIRDYGNIEIIIVDNSCSLAERRVLEELQSNHKGTIRAIFNETNNGFAQACNQAYSISSGSYIFLLNPDAYIVSPCLNILRNFLENTAGAAAVSPQVFWDDEMQYFFPVYPFPSPSEEISFKISCLLPVAGRLHSIKLRKKNILLWKSRQPVRVKNLSGGVVLLKRSAIRKSGGLFDDRFFLFYEDSDLFFRLRKSGYHLYILPQVKAVHNYHHNSNKLGIMSRAYPLYLDKHFKKSILRKLARFIPDRDVESGLTYLGSSADSPAFDIPGMIQQGYLFEWSPSPLFSPAIGYFGTGSKFSFSQQVWNLIDRGHYYSRITPASATIRNYSVFCWDKA